MSFNSNNFQKNNNKNSKISHSIDEENYWEKSSNIYLKTSNDFYHKPQLKKIKNKTPSSHLYKINYNSMRKSFTEHKNSIQSFILLNNEQDYKDKLFLEVVRVQKDIKAINKELKILQDDYNLIIQKNKTYYYIFQRLIEEEKNSSEEKNGYEDYDNYSTNTRIKKNNLQYEKYNNKINVLKKQINICDLIIKKNDAKLDDLIKRNKQKKYLALMNLLYNKENDIDELNKIINQYNYALYEVTEKFNFLNFRTQKYYNDINKLEKQLRNNNEMIYENNEEIKEINEKKKNLRNSKKKWIYKIKLREKEVDDLNKEENNIDKQLEENKKLFKEKENNEKILHNLKFQKEKIQSDINKIEKKLIILKSNYNDYNNDLELWSKEYKVLLKKSKSSGKKKDTKKDLEKEIGKYKNLISKRNEIEGNKEKNMNNKHKEIIDLNNKYLNDIKNFENEKNEFYGNINNLKNLLQNNKNMHEKLEKEFMELEQSYEKYKEKYTNIQKEEEEKNENEDKDTEENYNKEINKLKEKNDILKKEKEELLKKYEEKKKEVKQMNEVDTKLKKILEEIQRLTPS